MIGPVAVQPSLNLQLKNIPHLLSGDLHLIYRPPPLFLSTEAAIQGLPPRPLPDSRPFYPRCTGKTEGGGILPPHHSRRQQPCLSSGVKIVARQGDRRALPRLG